jgi:hypothetical protein
VTKNQNPVDSHRLMRLAQKMHHKGYRDGYVVAHTRQVLAKQMREFRGTMPQTEFAELLDKRQTVVSRLENPNYSGWTLGTLLEIASKLDVAVFVRFVDFPTFLKYTGVQTENAMRPAAYDPRQLDEFARSESIEELEMIKKTLQPKGTDIQASKKRLTRLATLNITDDETSAAGQPDVYQIRSELSELPMLARQNSAARYPEPEPARL